MIEDVLCLGVPAGIDPTDTAVLAELPYTLGPLIRETVWSQYGDPPFRPRDVLIEPSRWLITNDLADVELFQPAHDCERCRMGNDMARLWLTEHPGRWVAMANIRYEEVW